MTERKATLESSLLLTLEEISQLVSHSHDPGETLANIVRLIQGRFHTDVCSVYVLEPDLGELVLGATVGLKPESVGRVRMRLDEGLTGLVAEQMKPVMVGDAFQHPRFKFFPEAGEDPYHSFLGVPLVEGGVLHGVLVVQTAESREFSPNEVRMLVTVASQIAPLVSEAHLLERVIAATHAQPPALSPTAATPPCDAAAGACLEGSPLSSGVGAGEAYIVNGFDEWLQSVPADAANPAAEQRRLTAAIGAARDEITRISQRIATLVGEDHGAILQAQLMILQDRVIEQDLTKLVTEGVAAETALIRTLDTYVAAFEKLPSEYFRDRAFDIKDVFRRVLWHLRPHVAADSSVGAAKLVLVAHDVSVMDLFSVDLDRLAGVVAEHGGPHSHAAILARSLGIPMVGQVPRLFDRVAPGRQLLVDGSRGVVWIDPGRDLVRERITAQPQLGQAADRSPLAPREASEKTTDDFLERRSPLAEREDYGKAGEAIGGLPRVDANINLLCEVAPAIAGGAAGVGLFRTEFLFLARRTIPTEDEQVGTYRKLLTLLGGRPASIRTFDLRPDKMPHSAHLRATTAGPLDWRLVLDSPALQQLFREQVRAILRAATAGPAKILVPLVTRSEQLDFIVETVGRARDELARDGLEFNPAVPLGVMLEVAAATLMVDRWAEHVDYFALGTNDLVASALGIDRDDPIVASLNDPLHPAMLRTVRDVVTAAHAAGRPVTVCGEMAADPQGTLALAAFRVDALSVAVTQLASVRAALAAVSNEWLDKLPARLLSHRTAREARDYLREAKETA